MFYAVFNSILQNIFIQPPLLCIVCSALKVMQRSVYVAEPNKTVEAKVTFTIEVDFETVRGKEEEFAQYVSVGWLYYCTSKP